MRKQKAAILLSLVLAAGSVSACTQTAGQKESSLAAESDISSVASQTDASESESTQWSDEASVDEVTSAAEESAGTISSAEGSASSAQSEASSKQSSQSSKTAGTSTADRKTSAAASQTSAAKTPSASSKESASSKTSSQNSSASGKTQTSAQQPSRQTSQTSAPQPSTPQAPAPKPVDNSSVGDINLFNSLFSLYNRVTVQLMVSQAELNKLQNDYIRYQRIHSKSPIYRKASLTVTVNGQSFTMDEVGIRLKGNMSLSPVYNENGTLNLSHYKLSFNETFDDKDYYGSEAKVWASTEERKQRKNRRFATLKKMDLKWNSCYDESNIREIYASEMFRENGVFAQHIGLTQLIMNGQNYGVMRLYEPVDELFLEKRLPASALGGDLYKCGWTMRPCNYVSNQVTYGVDDKDTGAKFNFNLKTNEKTSNHASLQNLLNVLATRRDKASYENIIDTDYLANFLAASYFAGDPDDIRNNYNNHYIYFRKDNGKAIFIPYDNDRTLGITYGYNPDGSGMTKQSPYSDRAAGAGHTQANPMIKRAILDSDAFLKDAYEASLRRIVDSGFLDVNRFTSQYNLAYSNYASVVTPFGWFGNQEQNFTFSLNGQFTSGSDRNMSFATYSERILQTYHQAMD